jgi:bis(5'-nucleosyl)-tetraphosphatase (symmetrical)
MDHASLLNPSAEKHVVVDTDQRVVIVGDVHGCCDELRELIDQHHQPGDLFILAGDLVNKGPKSVEVLKTARELGCLSIVGNHELAALRGHADREGGKRPDASLGYAWTDDMTPWDIAYLQNLPFTVRLPRQNAIVVHAGLVPGVPLEAQQGFDMVRMRELVAVEEDKTTTMSGKEAPAYRAFETAQPGSSAWVI